MVKYSRWQEAQKATQALQLNLAGATQRYSYYQKLLGRTDAQIQSSIPQLDALDLGGLQALSFTQTATTSEPTMAMDPITPDIAQDPTTVSDGQAVTLTKNEVAKTTDMQTAQNSTTSAQTSEGLAGTLGFIPDFSINLEPMGVGARHNPWRDLRSEVSSGGGARRSRRCRSAVRLSGNPGRKDPDPLTPSVETGLSRVTTPKSEINAIVKQIRSAQIREAIAQKEYANHQAQMANAQEIIDFLSGNQVGGGLPIKESTLGFYGWMKREVKALYANSFQLAFEVVKQAERALQNRARRLVPHLHRFQLPRWHRGTTGRRETSLRREDDGNGLSRPEPARV